MRGREGKAGWVPASLKLACWMPAEVPTTLENVGREENVGQEVCFLGAGTPHNVHAAGLAGRQGGVRRGRDETDDR